MFVRLPPIPCSITRSGPSPVRSTAIRTGPGMNSVVDVADVSIGFSPSQWLSPRTAILALRFLHHKRETM